MKQIRIKLIDGGQAPVYKTADAACADCYASVIDDTTIYVGDRKLIPLGFAIQLPKGYEAVIRPRSGLSKSKIDVVTGVIDADYRGEVMANVINNSSEPFVVHRGDRICQMKIQVAEQFSFVAVPELDQTERGNGGFGHTGI